MSVKVLNPNAEVLNKSAALHMNINAAKGLQDVLKTNLGPKGTIKMWVALFIFLSFVCWFSIGHFIEICVLVIARLVGGAGDIKLTKDGNTLLKEMVSSPCCTTLSFFSYIRWSTFFFLDILLYNLHIAVYVVLEVSLRLLDIGVDGIEM